VPGPVRTVRGLGTYLVYSTVVRCAHDWWRDEDRPDDPLPITDPRASAALARGLAEGVAELAALRAAIGIGPWRP
jgi:hypothetical protein